MKKSWKLPGLLAVIVSVALGGVVYAKWTTSADVPKDNLQWAFTQAGQQPEKLLIDVIDSAKSTLDLAIYSLTYPDVIDALKKAKMRGVQVRIITDRIQSEGKAQKEALKILGSAGIPIKVNSHSGLMHLKMTISDNEIATTGSYNYSKAASTENDEILLVIRNEEVAKAFARQFSEMWSNAGKFRTISPYIAQSNIGNADAANAAIAGGGDDACAKPLIKGNINSKGEKIYHLPGGEYYSETIPEEMFCSEKAAKAAGYRKSLK
ncbi:MAG TPA: phospholipase D-like domain-containing protein [Bacilli bacterium]